MKTKPNGLKNLKIQNLTHWSSMHLLLVFPTARCQDQARTKLDYLIHYRMEKMIQWSIRKYRNFLFFCSYNYICIKINTNFIWCMNQYHTCVSDSIFPASCHPEVKGEFPPHRVDESVPSLMRLLSIYCNALHYMESWLNGFSVYIVFICPN